MATEVCFAARARRLNRVLSALYDERLRELGISIGQLDILVTLLFAGAPIRPIDLAREMQMERSTVTRNITKLAALGAVDVRPGNHGRERLISVTATGERLVARAEPAWGDAQEAARMLLRSDGITSLEKVSDRVAAPG